MVNQIHIKNFKSIVDTTIDLGRVNLFIGENGSGKSNILEALAFASHLGTLGIENKITEFTPLDYKGIRANSPLLFSSAFGQYIQDIEFDFLVNTKMIKLLYKYYSVDFEEIEEEGWREVTMRDSYFSRAKIREKYRGFINDDTVAMVNTSSGEKIKFEFNIDSTTPAEIKNQILSEENDLNNYFDFRHGDYLGKYVIYCPETTSLRKFEGSNIGPLGIHGEGLFSLIKSLSKDNGSLQHIKEHLELIDWFEDFSIPGDLMSNEYKISIKDRFINSDLRYLDQRSANEGFLFLLFYVVLFTSKKTPQFFAIDNIEASFNPKLCTRLINMLVELAKKNEKQVLMTTHNPATLDGLDLNDPEQRLFVVRRNIDGHTIVTRITEKPKVDLPMKLSEMWTKGLLGGLPDNF